MDDFKIKVPQDFNGASLAEVEDESRFRHARPGDHLVSPFQCPCCQSQNIRGRSLNPDIASDVAFETLCIRASLDAFWAHASTTISKHVSQVKFMERYSAQLEVNPFPELGPWPLGKDLGMLTAIMVLMRSKERGRNDSTVKLATARQARSTLTVIWEASPASGEDLVLSSASARGRYITTLNPAEGRWYHFFTLGVAARMGDVVRQDRAYTLEVLLKLLDMFEEEWIKFGRNMRLHNIAACMFLLVSCLGGMRGYEVMWTDLAALRYDVLYCEERSDFEAISWPIVGLFKNEHGRLGHYMIPIAGITHSKITFFKWTQRFVGALQRRGITRGWAFQRPDGSKAKASDYRDNIFGKLEEIQATTSLIDDEVDVWEDYGVQRSGRRFFVTQSLIRGIPPHVIEAQCRWSTDRAKRNKTVTRTMMHHYSEVRNMKSVLIQPSKAF